MLEKVIVRIIYYTSSIVTGIGWLAIIGPISLCFLCMIFNGNPKLPFSIYNWYSEILGSYGFLKVLVITIIAGIIYFSTNPFVEEKNSK
jgi:hypothetical protein